MNLVYIAGPYRGADISVVRSNINAAKRTAIRLIDQLHHQPVTPTQWFPVIPHMNTALFDFQAELADIVPDSYYLQGTLEQMRACKAVILTGQNAIQRSVGTTSEVMEANRLGIPVFTNVETFIHYITDDEYFMKVNAQVATTVALATAPSYDEAVTFGLF